MNGEAIRTHQGKQRKRVGVADGVVRGSGLVAGNVTSFVRRDTVLQRSEGRVTFSDRPWATAAQCR